MNRIESSPNQSVLQRLSLKSRMTVETDTVEGAIFVIQISDTQRAVWSQQRVEIPQYPLHIGNMMQGHQGINQIVTFCR